MTDVMKPLTFTCEIELAKPADEVWEWLGDLRNALLVNQFHTEIGDLPPDGRVGTEVTIVHELVPFPPNERIGRVTAYQDEGDYKVAWSERLQASPYPDPFPHGEAWTVSSVDKAHCRVSASVHGAWTSPVGRTIAPYVMEPMLTTVLKKDLQEMAFAVGAIEEMEEVEPIPEHDRLHALTLAREINGIPINEYFDDAAPVFGDYKEYMAAHPPRFG